MMMLNGHLSQSSVSFGIGVTEDPEQDVVVFSNITCSVIMRRSKIQQFKARDFLHYICQMPSQSKLYNVTQLSAYRLKV